jgi:hypothetical protein
MAAYPTLRGDQIRPNSLSGTHFADGSIPESKLNINWAAHATHTQFKKHVFSATGGETDVLLPEGDTFSIANDDIDVYLNGQLLAETLHYTEKEDGVTPGVGDGVTMANPLQAGDVVIIRYPVPAP